MDKPLILIVDDTPTNVQVLAEILRADYRIKVAGSGKAAFEVIAGHGTPDLILLDVMMPELDGYEVCRRLKADSRTRDIPVIFVTARDAEDDEAAGLAAGAIDYLTKPVSAPIVKARVRNHLLLKRGLDALAERNRALEETARLREDVERITRHDLKGPLSGIIGFSDLLLEEGRLGEDEEEMVRRINAAGYQILGMINRSLDLYKMESGSYHLQPVTVDLVPVLRRVIGDQRPLVAAKNLRTELSADGQPLAEDAAFAIHGEELLCYSLLANLVGNAMEASPPGEAIRCTLEHRGPDALLHIHNRGAVPAEIRGRFFEKYITAGKDQGTGLGTYSARLMARVQDGDVDMATGETEGTTVTVRLPAA